MTSRRRCDSILNQIHQGAAHCHNTEDKFNEMANDWTTITFSRRNKKMTLQSITPQRVKIITGIAAAANIIDTRTSAAYMARNGFIKELHPHPHCQVSH